MMMGYRNQVLAAFAASLGYFVLGMDIGYPTKALPQLLKEDFLNEQNGSWFAAFGPLCGLFMTTTGGLMSSQFGRKSMFLIGMPLSSLGWLLIGFSINLPMLFAGRILASSSIALLASSVGVYIAESVDPKLRANLVTLAPFAMACGMLSGWTIGYFSTWRIMALASVFPCILNIVLMAYLPETPYWLVEKNRQQEADISLAYFRSKDYQDELAEMQQKHESKPANSYSWLCRRLFSRAFFKPFACVGILQMLFSFTGYDILQVYMELILEESPGSIVRPEVGPILAGLVRVFSAGLCALFIGKMSPKLLFALSQLTAALCMLAIGLFAYFKPATSSFAWIPLIAILLTIITRGMGTLPVTNMLMNELFPTEIRTQAIGITTTLFLATLTFNLKLYPTLVDFLDFYGACFFYFTMGLVCCIWGILTIPDNRGQSLVKVEENLEKEMNE